MQSSLSREGDPILPWDRVSGWRARRVEAEMLLHHLNIVREAYPDLRSGARSLRAVLANRERVYGKAHPRKLACVDGRYFTDLYTPGWPSLPYRRFVEGELHRQQPLDRPVTRFTNVHLAVTRRCALSCEHCFEWDSLETQEVLTLDALKGMVASLQAIGVGQIHLTGGEPMLRLEEVLELIRTAQPTSAFWLLSSGQNLTLDSARRLKDAGLTGVVLSLDHWDPAAHNRFRGSPKAFGWVEEGSKSARAVGLACALTLVVTRETANRQDLLAWMALARRLEAPFVQWLEPKPVGHYAGKDVALPPEALALLDELMLQFNYAPEYAAYPSVTYHGFYQRRLGCFSSGHRAFYVDTAGDVLGCPFCRHSTGNLLRDPIERVLEQLKARGCSTFGLSPV